MVELEHELLSTLIPHLSTHIASQLLEQIPSERVVRLLEQVPDAICALVLRHISLAKRDSIVAILPGNRAKTIEMLLSFGPGTAASIMDNTVPAVYSTETVGGCISLLKM